MRNIKNKYLVIGLGVTGFSVLRFLHSHDEDVAVCDMREKGTNSADAIEVTLQTEYPDIKYHFGRIVNIINANVYVVSPGISLEIPELVDARSRGIKIIGDIDIFMHYVSCAVIAITGTNGKSTVTSLIEHIFISAGFKARAVGNIGLPVLDALSADRDENIDYYILELSSFQLESSTYLPLEVAMLLNISEDHLDRHHTMESYLKIKQKIFDQANYAVLNKEEPDTFPTIFYGQVIQVTINEPLLGEWGIIYQEEDITQSNILFDSLDEVQQNATYITYGNSKVIDVSDMKIKGNHNYMNAMFAGAAVHCMGISLGDISDGLKSFEPLAHRVTVVANHKSVMYINDSKATNIGATKASVESIGNIKRKNIILFLGGKLKGNDPIPLREPLSNYVKNCYVYGEDADILLDRLQGSSRVEKVKEIKEGLVKSLDISLPGDIVLLAPACASFDQFNSFEHRGECFTNWVKEIILNEHLGEHSDD